MMLELGVTEAQLKWPNDVLVMGAKVCGILAETRGLDRASPHCVLGIGINVRQREFPADLVRERAVTSLSLCGVNTDPRAVLSCLLPHLAWEMERVESNPASTLQSYFTATGLANRRVRVFSGEFEIEGIWRELDLARGLGLMLPDGSLRRVRLEHVRALVATED